MIFLSHISPFTWHLVSHGFLVSHNNIAGKFNSGLLAQNSEELETHLGCYQVGRTGLAFWFQTCLNCLLRYEGRKLVISSILATVCAMRLQAFSRSVKCTISQGECM